jgi:hypothetical protein
LDIPKTGELPIYPMTAKDEILLKTPDALLNGQGVVDVIESCCPHITDAWEIPSTDVDAILIAIRVASYGNTMNIDTKCPHCETENRFEVELTGYLDSIQCPDYDKKLEHEKIRIKIKPQTYASLNETSKISYEQQRMLENIVSDNTEDQTKISAYKHHITRLVDLNAKLLVDSTQFIELVDSGTIVSEPEFIQEFYLNCDSEICKKLQERIVELSQEGALKSQTGTCENCSKTYDVALTFDYASFFANSS